MADKNSNDDILTVIEYIFGTLDHKKILEYILADFDSINYSFDELADSESKCIDGGLSAIVLMLKNKYIDLYNKASLMVIDDIAKKEFGMRIELVIMKKDMEQIRAVFEKYLTGFSTNFISKVQSDLEGIANMLNKRFSFDDLALIHLIEASKGTNIQKEEGRDRKTPGGFNILGHTSKGYIFREEDSTARFTANGFIIPNFRKDSKTQQLDYIEPSSYPGYSSIYDSISKKDIMRQLIGNVLDNLELCYDMYKKYYLDTRKKPKIIAAKLADDSVIKMQYKIDGLSIPHILGIPTGKYLSEEARKILEIGETDSAETVLKELIKKRERIIEDGGLIETNGKLYQLLPWEKIVLKMSSFMRGDFFKTCMCLVKLKQGKYLEDPYEEYVSVSTTKYNQDFIRKPSDREILEMLFDTKKHYRDFIFRGYISDGNGIYNPNTLLTGKAENIYVGRERERLLTLQRFRQILGNNEGAWQIVQSIMIDGDESEFSPYEQVLLGEDIKSGLGVKPKMTKEALELHEKIYRIFSNAYDFTNSNDDFITDDFDFHR